MFSLNNCIIYEPHERPSGAPEAGGEEQPEVKGPAELPEGCCGKIRRTGVCCGKYLRRTARSGPKPT